MYIYHKRYMSLQTINIDFPFRDSINGDFIKLNDNDADAIKADLMHLLLTNKGERLYLPDFGTNLRKFIFEPNDSLTFSDVKAEINETVNKYIPKLKITTISVEESNEAEYTTIVKLDYVVSDDIFEVRDSITIEL